MYVENGETLAYLAKRKDLGGIRMTGGVIGKVVLGIWLACLTTAAAQLPPDVLVDQYLLRADRLMEAKDAKGALEMMGKIVALQQEHGLTLPNEFYFKRAKVAFAAGSIQAAQESVNKYLTVAGRQGEFYGEALELSLEIAELGADRTPCAGQPKGSACWMELANQPKTYVWDSSYHPYKTVTWTGEYLGNLAHGKGTLRWGVDIDPKPLDASPSQATEPKCVGQPKGSSCWMEVSGQPGCYVWNGNLQPDETVTWTGGCSMGRAQGEGTYKWVLEGGEKTSGGKGLLKDGKRHGQWTSTDAEGKEGKGFYVYGEYVGRSAEDEDVMEGRLVKGKRHGNWIWHDKDGNLTRKGPYAEGKREGQWVIRYAGGNVHEGPYVNGKRQGQWVWRWTDGTVGEGPMVDDKRHGDWVERFTSGGRVNGAYMDGKKHGHWVWRDKDGKAWTQGPYVHGKKDGDWVEYEYGQRQTGSYAEGKPHGTWLHYGLGEDKEKIELIKRYKNGTLHGEYVEYLQAVELFSRDARDPNNIGAKGSYVEGERHGHWILGREKGSYVHGEKDGPWIERWETIPGTLIVPDDHEHDRELRRWDDASGSYVAGKRHGHWELSKRNDGRL